MFKIFYRWFVFYIICLALFSCKQPVLLVLEKEHKGMKGVCETIFYTDSVFTEIVDFEVELKKQIRKESRRCKCDTMYIDLNDLGNMRHNNPGTYWGICPNK
ncbi:hypothetical protein KFE94_07225 [bacterium SCSIO 12643]|nr:hypothetical protein KFE94_07225 [bacterium SCSIO 12643]